MIGIVRFDTCHSAMLRQESIGASNQMLSTGHWLRSPTDANDPFVSRQVKAGQSGDSNFNLQGWLTNTGRTQANRGNCCNQTFVTNSEASRSQQQRHLINSAERRHGRNTAYNHLNRITQVRFAIMQQGLCASSRPKVEAVDQGSSSATYLEAQPTDIYVVIYRPCCSSGRAGVLHASTCSKCWKLWRSSIQE